MRPPRFSTLVARIRAEHLCRELFHLAFALAVVVMLAGQTAAFAGDIFRTAPASGTAGGATSTGSSGAAAAPLGSTIDTAAQLQARALAALNRTDAAIRAVNSAQQAARAAAVAAASAVPNGLQKGGLEPMLDLSKMELWKGAAAPTTPDSAKPNEVVIVQKESQALLQWKTFNIGKDTTLTFDQSKGGTNAGQWIAFNYVRDPSGRPSQILGALKTIGAADAAGKVPVGGQVFVLNPNGILFGGKAQVNVHGLVASSLPINSNLVQRGLLNNPDDQFLFSALPQAATSGDSFDPGVAVPDVAPEQLPYDPAGSGNTKVMHAPVGDEPPTYHPYAYGDVVVQPGATLTAPSNADRVGGRIALIGTNVTNAGTISTEDGQTILAAGLQVGWAAHNSADPTLRGLDVFVGRVEDKEALPLQGGAGVATNAGLDSLAALGLTPDEIETIGTADNPKRLNVLGLIEAPRGNVFITGQTVNQSGAIDSSTSVSYNGRVDLVAGFNAVPSKSTTETFLYQSYVDDDATAAAVSNSGRLTLGRDSVVRILPDGSETEKIVGDLALPSQVNLQAGSIHFETAATVLAPGAATPPPTAVGAKLALGSDRKDLGAGVAIRAGRWLRRGDIDFGFIQDDSSQQIDFDADSMVSVAGYAGATASVTDNIISVELRGSELANSPVQRDSSLRGQTVQVDLRQHGAWDPTLNDGAGGYAWVGTPLANTAGWVGLTSHTARQLSTDGGSVLLKAGGAVVLQPSSTGKFPSIDVSGGYINYQAGETRTTKLRSGTNIIDISKADPGVKYDGIYTGTQTVVDPKWGTTTVTSDPFALPTHESGYVQGGRGGRVSIVSPLVALDGALWGNTVAGPRQRTPSPVYSPSNPPDPASPAYAGAPGWLIAAGSLPVASQFSLTLQRQYLNDDPYLAATAGRSVLSFSPTPAKIVIGQAVPAAAKPAADAFSETGAYELHLSPSLFRSDGDGFGIVRIDNSAGSKDGSGPAGSVEIAANTKVALAPGGSLALLGANVTVGDGAAVEIAGGNLALTAFDVSPSQSAYLDDLKRKDPVLTGKSPPGYDPTKGRIQLGKGALLSTAGALVDERVGSATAGGALVTKGGNVSLKGSDVDLASSSLVDVSGGAVVSLAGKITYADAGGIAIETGLASYSAYGGTVHLAGALRGYAGLGRTGGSFSLRAPAIAITESAGFPALAAAANGIWTDPATGEVSLAPKFFSMGGFTKFALTGLGFSLDEDGSLADSAPAMVVADKTVVSPHAQFWSLLPGRSAAVFTPAKSGIGKPVDLSLNALGLPLTDLLGMSLGNDIGVLMEAGSAITTGPGGKVTLSGATVDVLGSITAPGGVIALTQSTAPNDQNKTPGGSFTPTVHLGAESKLDASGAAVWALDVDGDGQPDCVDVLDGGSITVAGNIVAERGAALDVSGTGGIVTALEGRLPGTSLEIARRGYTSVPKFSNGGSLVLQGFQMLLSGATLSGRGAKDTAGVLRSRGGNLMIQSDRQKLSDPPALRLDANQMALAVTSANPQFCFNGIGQALTDGPEADGFSLDDGSEKHLGLSRFGVDSLAQSGFDALAFTVGSGALTFQGDVLLEAARQVSLGDSGVVSVEALPATPEAPGSLKVHAPYVKLGRDLLQPGVGSAAPLLGRPDAGTGASRGYVEVSAGALIDVGDLWIDHVGATTLDASAGSIRGSGTLEVAGSLKLTAGQIYPTTGSSFTAVAWDSQVPADGAMDANPLTGTITVRGGATVPALPYSAGGTLALHATTIDQGGVLRAPIGQIRLGSITSGGAAALSGVALPVTSNLVLRAGSVTSVAAVEAAGQELSVPYGINVNGDSWIAPSGADITLAGPPLKQVTLAAGALDLQAAAKVDLTGGGDLFAYRFVPGTGGTIDILGASSLSFAVVPGYSDGFAPFAPFNPAAENSLGMDTGYVLNAKLGYRPGDQVYLGEGGGLKAGVYTILPARYALLPGAFLVTPSTASATTANVVATPLLADGSALVSGYRLNGFDGAGAYQPGYTSFGVASSAVVAKRATYELSSANKFFAPAADDDATVAPRRPVDAGQLVLVASASMRLNGSVAAAAAKGRGGLIDLGSPLDIVIGQVPQGVDAASVLQLDPVALSQFGAASLLIGGTRGQAIDGTTTVETTTANLTVANDTGTALEGADLILVATDNLKIADGAVLRAKTGTTAGTADTLRLAKTVSLTSGATTATIGAGENVLFVAGTGTGAAANAVSATSSGVITRASGAETAFQANEPLALGAGDRVRLNAAGSITVNQIGPKTSTVAMIVGTGDFEVDHLSAGAAPLAVAGDRSLLFPEGTGAGTTASRVVASVSGSIVGANGTTMSFAADEPLALTKGDRLQLDGDGSLVVVSPVSAPATVAYVLGDSALRVADLRQARLSFDRGGQDILFPEGTASGTKVAPSVAGRVINTAGVERTFAANEQLILARNDKIQLHGAGSLTVVQIGSEVAAVPVVLGDGALVRVSADATAAGRVEREAMTHLPHATKNDQQLASVTIGRATFEAAAGSVQLDSSDRMAIDVASALTMHSVAVAAGQLALQLDPSATEPVDGATVLANGWLERTVNSATTVAFGGNAATIDLYGAGTLGRVDLDRLELLGGAVRGFANGDGVAKLQAHDIRFGNTTAALAPESGAASGSLSVEAGSSTVAGTIGFLGGAFSIQQFARAYLIASGGVVAEKSGTCLMSGGDLTITTPVITADAAVSQGIVADGALTLNAAVPVGTGTVTPGLGASLSFTGSSVAVADSTAAPGASLRLALPSGILSLSATGTGKGLVVGGGTLDVGGVARSFYDQTRYTNAGQISLSAADGNVEVKSGSVVSVAANAGGGNAGEIQIAAANGTATVAAGTLRGTGGVAGETGSFSLDAKTVDGVGTDGSRLTGLAQALREGGFTNSIAVRVRTGDLAIGDDTDAEGGRLDGTLRAHDVTVAADSGTIKVSGTIDASGPTGGSILLAAGGDVTLDPTAVLDAAGLGTVAKDSKTGKYSLISDGFDAAGKGGAVTVESRSGRIDLQTGALVDLLVAGNDYRVNVDTGKLETLPEDAPAVVAVVAANESLGKFGGTLHLRARQTPDHLDLTVAPIGATVDGESSVVVEGYSLYELNSADLRWTGGFVDLVKAAVKRDGLLFAGDPADSADSAAAQRVAALRNGLFAGNASLDSARLHLQPGAEIVTTADPSLPTRIELTAAGTSTLKVPDPGVPIAFPSGTGAGTVKLSTAATVTLANGMVEQVAAGTIRSLSAGSTVQLAAGGTLTLTTLAGGTTSLPIDLPNGRTFTASKATVKADGSGSYVALDGLNQSISLPGGVAIGLPVGTPGAGTADGGPNLKASQAATVLSADGTSLGVYAAGVAFAVPAGGQVRLAAAGTLSYFKPGVGTPRAAGSIHVALPEGSYAVTNNATIATASGSLKLAGGWDLSTYRFGPAAGGLAGSGEPGNLTLRTAGNLLFLVDANANGISTNTPINSAGSLSDGFDNLNPVGGSYNYWKAPLLAPGTRSWSYRLVAGADFNAANVRAVQSLATLAAGTGSVLVGQSTSPLALPTTTTNDAKLIVPRFYQTIRTGTGGIDIVAGRDVRLLNPLATIYTAGTAVDDPTKLVSAADFDVPVLQASGAYVAQYALGGGNLSLHAQNDVARSLVRNGAFTVDAVSEMPTSWLYRRGQVEDGLFAGRIDTKTKLVTEVLSTTWWTDYSNFFDDVGALGGGTIEIVAGHDVSNVSASVATNARMPGKGAQGAAIASDAAKLVELGGGDLSVRAGRNVDGGTYYVERGNARVDAGAEVTTNSARVSVASFTAEVQELPTTFFLGKGRIEVAAGGNVRLGPVANPFWLPQGLGNEPANTNSEPNSNRTYFSTYDVANAVSVSSLGGAVSLQAQPLGTTGASLAVWYGNRFTLGSPSIALSQPWLKLSETGLGKAAQGFETVMGVLPATLRATAFSGDIEIVGKLVLASSPSGTVDLLAAGSLNGVVLNGAGSYGSALVSLSDADPAALPGIASPLTPAVPTAATGKDALVGVNAVFADSGRTNLTVAEKALLHGQTKDANGLPVALHAADDQPVRVYAAGGDLSGLALIAPKATRVLAERDISDISFYLQNVSPLDTSVVAAGRDLTAYAPFSTSGGNLTAPSIKISSSKSYQVGDLGDIQIAGSGTLEVLAGRNLDVGGVLDDSTASNVDGTNTGIGLTSIGAMRNPYLPINSGASILAVAGAIPAGSMGSVGGLSGSALSSEAFAAKFLDPTTALGQRYLAFVATQLALPKDTAAKDVRDAFDAQRDDAKARLAVGTFFEVLRLAGKDYNDTVSPNYRKYTDALAAISTLFSPPGIPLPTDDDIKGGGTPDRAPRPEGAWLGNLSLTTRLIKTFEGGDITVLVPGGGITVGLPTDPQKADQGILTQRGGRIDLFAADSINVGTSRIFTLRGGDETLWSTWGDIAAGSGSKTVFSAPPTRVLIDAQSADVQNDLAGLATGAGIGVLATLKNVEPGNVSLMAPVGTLDAGDAGIRSSGNLTIAARTVTNAANIKVGGSSAGVPAVAVPSLGNVVTQVKTVATTTDKNPMGTEGENRPRTPQARDLPSLIQVEVLGYGGSDKDKDENEKDGDSDSAQSAPAADQAAAPAAPQG